MLKKVLIFKKSIIFLFEKLRILNKSTIFVSRKGDNNEGNTRTILLRTTQTKLRCLAVDRGERNRSLRNIHQGLSKQGGSTRVCMAAEWLG